MIHYHGSPISGPADHAASFFVGRHALVSFEYPESLPLVAETCQSFAFDNGAYTSWRSGRDLDVGAVADWVGEWMHHPAFDWALIPDVIDGDEEANDRLVADWRHPPAISVPVWHLHEPISRLERLCRAFPRVALGSSGQWSSPGSTNWWTRMAVVMDAICDAHGRPPAKFHGLRMLDPDIFRFLPLASADSTNAAVNAGSLGRFGQYPPPSAAQRATVIADRIEQHSSAPIWHRHFLPKVFELEP